jgi:hypothetical protein
MTNSHEARQAQADLLAALGTESNPCQWMVFMREVTRLLPDVLSSGRPTKEAIASCAIGQLGFTSWSEMIEAPIEVGGLGWNFSAWKAWRRAWATVQAAPWLLEQDMGSSEINGISIECRKAGRDLPQSLDELQALRADLKVEADAKKLADVSALTDKIAAAERRAVEVEAHNLALREQLEKILATNAAQAEEIGRLKAAPAVEPAPKMSRWEHLRAVFS